MEIDEIPTVTKGTVKTLEKKKGLSFIDKIKLFFKQDNAFFITMFNNNNTVGHFIITTKDRTFTYKKDEYQLIPEKARYDLNHKQEHLFYHEGYFAPIDKSIIQEGDSAFFSVTPENAKPLIEMEYVRILATANELNRWLKFAVIIGGITAFLVICNLFLTLKTSGIVK